MGNETLAEVERLTGLYDRFRAQVEHENELYNQRIIWLITMQAFLFATIGLLLQARITAAPEWATRIDGLIVVISVVGSLVALISNRLLGNARRALAEIGRRWSERMRAASPDVSALFPDVQGVSGGSQYTLLRSGHLPKVFVVAWLSVALLLLAPVDVVEQVFTSLNQLDR